MQKLNKMPYGSWVVETKPLVLRLGITCITIKGGPYADKQPHQFGVNLLEKPTYVSNVWFPIKDFSIPTVDPSSTILKIIMAGLAGNEVYVGCLGGSGRTGTMLALVTKTVHEYNKVKFKGGITPSPIQWVRRYYKSSAVETREQERYIDSYKPHKLFPAITEILKVVNPNIKSAKKTWAQKVRAYFK